MIKDQHHTERFRVKDSCYRGKVILATLIKIVSGEEESILTGASVIDFNPSLFDKVNAAPDINEFI